jgi:hypothetical protein
MLLIGCSSSNPDIKDTAVTDNTPVTGQRIYVQVNAVTDNPPTTYAWTASAGDIEEINGLPYAIYWTAPETPGPCIVTVTVKDSDGNKITHNINLLTGARSLEGDLTGPGSVVLSMAKQSDSYVGGVWVSVKGSMLRYITSQTNRESIWAKDFDVMLARTYETTGYYTIWGAAGAGNVISMLTSDTDSTLACSTCSPSDGIRALALDVLNRSVLWVGTDTILCYVYLYSDTGEDSVTWTPYIHTKVYGLSEGPDYVWAATENGIYRLDGKTEPVAAGKTTSVLAVEGDSGTDVWSVTKGRVMKNFAPLSAQPPAVVDSLDADIKGGVWCGKYRWDGSSWKGVEGLEQVNVVRSVASTEGLVYLLSDSGVLYRW